MIENSKDMFPSNPWNDFILEKNKEIMKLDNFSDVQHRVIVDAYNEALHKIKDYPEYFNRQKIDEWYRSQIKLYEINYNKNLRDKFGDDLPYIDTGFSFLYTEKLDLSEILTSLGREKLKNLELEHPEIKNEID